MSNRRSRKKRRGAEAPGPVSKPAVATERPAAARGPATADRPPAPGKGAAAARPRSRLEVRDGVARPDGIWAPFPLTEIGMAVGILLFAVGLASGLLLLLIGLAVLTVVTVELCLREHFAGFRSHSLLLALLPVTIGHMAVFELVSSRWRGPVALVVDLVLAAALAYLLQRRFRVARQRAQAARIP